MLLSLGSDLFKAKHITAKYIEAIEAFPNAGGTLTVKIYMNSKNVIQSQMQPDDYRNVLDRLAESWQVD